MSRHTKRESRYLASGRDEITRLRAFGAELPNAAMADVEQLAAAIAHLTHERNDTRRELARVQEENAMHVEFGYKWAAPEEPDYDGMYEEQRKAGHFDRAATAASPDGGADTGIRERVSRAAQRLMSTTRQSTPLGRGGAEW